MLRSPQKSSTKKEMAVALVAVVTLVLDLLFTGAIVYTAAHWTLEVWTPIQVPYWSAVSALVLLRVLKHELTAKEKRSA